MIRRGSPVRAIRLFSVAFLAVCLVECSSDVSSGPRVLDVQIAGPSPAKGAQGPGVSSANPSFGDQGTTLDVHVLGSGFTDGASATWLLNGVADGHVHTNSTHFVSSSEVVANITIASDAALAFWDVQVALIGGKNGVGSDAFEVTSAQVLSLNPVTAVLATNELLEAVGYTNDAFVVDDASNFVDLGGGQAWGLDPQGSTALGRNGSAFATAWSKQPDGSWAATTLPPAPNSAESNATSGARAADGSLLVGGWDGTPGPRKGTSTQNRPVVWQRVGSTWMPPTVYALPSGATTGSARTVNPLGQIAGNVDASGVGAVWDSPTAPIRLDGLPNGINSAGTIVVGVRGATPVYWWRDPVTQSWRTTGVALPSIAGASCAGGEARGLNDAGVIVGESCNAKGKRQATVWTLDVSSGTPLLVSMAALPGLGASSPSELSSAAGITNSLPYAVAGMAAQSNGQHYVVRWLLR